MSKEIAFETKVRPLLVRSGLTVQRLERSIYFIIDERADEIRTYRYYLPSDRIVDIRDGRKTYWFGLFKIMNLIGYIDVDLSCATDISYRESFETVFRAKLEVIGIHIEKYDTDGYIVFTNSPKTNFRMKQRVAFVYYVNSTKQISDDKSYLGMLKLWNID